MGWPLKTAERELVEAFAGYIENNSDILMKKDILIWGASVRGTILGILLQKYGYSQFQYVDNDERKWGENINGHDIVSPESIRNLVSDYYVLVPIEYGNEIKEQLQDWGLAEEENFSILRAEINEKYANEFFRKYKNKRLILGESFLNETVLEEKKSKSIKERIWEEFGKEETKILSMNCMGMQSFYYILQLQIKFGHKPEELWLFASYETLTEFHHLLSRTQHAGVLKLIQEQGNINDSEFIEYIKLAQERAADYKLEYTYSPQRTTDGKIMDMDNIRKSYLKLNLLYDLNLNSEEAKYLKKILIVSQNEGIEMSVILAPINYELAREYYGREFNNVYYKNNLKLEKFVADFEAKFINMSALLPAKDFVVCETINDGLYKGGQERVIQYLKEMEE